MSRLSVILLAFMIIAALAPAAPAPVLPAHPRLLFNGEGIDAFKKKIGEEPWKALWVKNLAALDKELRRKLELPPRGGNWSHNYVCPDHGARLDQGRKIGPWQWEHKCPVGPHILRGDPSKGTLDFDGNAIAAIHARNAALLRDLGLAWQVTGDRRYAERARAILAAYTERYLTYPRHSNSGKPQKGSGGGRVASQPLTEASWLIPMAQGADLIWDTLDEAGREGAEKKLFRPALEETILNKSTRPTIHNIQCYRNSAVGLVGFLLGDRALIENAVDGIHGYRANMAKGVQPDGIWFEGAWGYHFFALGGIWPLTEAARNCGIDLYGPELKRMLEAPLRMAMPNGRLPAFNDSSEVSMEGRAEIYELAYARYKDPLLAALPARGRRTADLALWFGEDRLPAADASKRGPFVAEASGYVVFESGEKPRADWLCLKFGPHGGGHGHNDKNNFVYYAGNEVVMPDSGSHAYGSPLHKGWDKTSFAHNTLVVDAASQAEATGRLLDFGTAGAAQYAMTDAGAIYPGVRFVRTAALLRPGLLVVLDHVRADRERTLDIVCHLKGRWEAPPPGTSFAPPQAPGYQYLKDPTVREAAAGAALNVKTPGGQPASIMLAAGSEPTQVIAGTGIGSSTADKVPVAIFRRTAKDAVFAWAVRIGTEPVEFKVAPMGDAAAATLTAAGKTWKIESNPAAGKVRVTE